jgi:hypothetical protein
MISNDQLVSYYGASACIETVFIDKVQFSADCLSDSGVKSFTRLNQCFEDEMKAMNNSMEV